MSQQILVVDDDRLIREMMREALGPEGFRVVTEASGPAALDRIRTEGPPAVVITDLSMSEMDGLELLELIKREWPKTDVIILTDHASRDSAMHALRVGAADYLRKPVSPPEVIYGVKRAILRRRVLDENESLRSRLQAFESCRVLTSCLEPADILPLSLDIILTLTGSRRAIGRLLHPSARPVDGACLLGFDDAEVAALRDEIDRGKLFDPALLESSAPAGSTGLEESLTRLGLEVDELLSLPLRLDGRLVGGIWIFSEGRRFEEHAIRAAELVVAQSELALANAERFLQAREKAFIDDVTDLYNARYLLAALDREVSRAERSELSLSVLFLDLDRFKSVNDSHGHLVGSRVLREVGQQFQRSIRSIDTVGRYGGDEYTILLVDTDHEGALRVAERIRQSVEEAAFGAERGLRLSLTVSIGVATFPQHGTDRDALLDRSDKAMYLGKALGRNQACSADELTATTHG